MRDQHSLDRLVTELYAGTLDSSAWDRALLGLADLIGSAGALLFAVNPTTATVIRDEIHRLDPEAVHAYRQHWVSQDIRLDAAIPWPVGEPVFERKLQLQQKWERTAIFNEFLVSRDTPYFLATWLHKSPDKVVALSFQATLRHGPFNEPEARRLKRLLPHVTRALVIRDRLERQNVRVNTISSAMDRLQFGLFVLDAKARILEASAMAEQIMRGERAMRRDKDGTLWLREPAGSQLRDLLRSGVQFIRRCCGVLRVPRTDGKASLSVLVLPMPDVTVSWTGTNEACWLVFVFDPDRRHAPAVEIVAAELGLTEREAQVASLLALGADMPLIAKRLGITANTARTHLKHIFNKTDTQSQGELIRRILTGPSAFMKGDSPGLASSNKAPA